MMFDLFDSPELLDIQRTGFYRFLNQGIPQLLAKEFPIKVKNGNCSIELLLNEQDIRLIAPEDNPRDCILKMKTYSCKLYAKIEIVCKNASRTIVYQNLPEWVFLGQLPMMTKRGHFIINGSPRVIVHQVVRAPGIYFQKLSKKDDQNRARFYGDIIPLKGVWVRLQMTKKGRIEAKFKKGKKVEAEFLQRCFQVIEDQTRFFSDTPFGSQSFDTILPKEEYVGGARRNDELPLFPVHARALQQFPRPCPCFAKPNPCALPWRAPTRERVASSFSTHSGRAKRVDGTSCSLFLRSKKMRRTPHGELLYGDYSKLLEKRRSRAESKAEHDAFVHTYDKLYRTTQDKELEEWQKKKRNQDLFKGSYKTPPICNRKGFSQDYNTQPCRNVACVPLKGKKGGEKYGSSTGHGLSSFSSQENAFKRKKCSENLFAQFKMRSRYDLGLLGREKINNKFGCASYKACNTQLTALDLSSASLWLYKLRKGEQNSDDIDHSQNRRVRTSGELLQTQFENGVDRLKNVVSTKLEERRVKISNHSTCSSILSYKRRCTPASSFKRSTKSKSSHTGMVPYLKGLSNRLRSRANSYGKGKIDSKEPSKGCAKSFANPCIAPCPTKRGQEHSSFIFSKRKPVALQRRILLRKPAFPGITCYYPRRGLTQAGALQSTGTAPRKAQNRSETGFFQTSRACFATLKKNSFSLASETRHFLEEKASLCFALQIEDLHRKFAQNVLCFANRRFAQKIFTEYLQSKAKQSKAKQWGRTTLAKGVQRKVIARKNSGNDTHSEFALRSACIGQSARKMRETAGAKGLVRRGVTNKENSYKLSAKELFTTKPITGALREFFGSNPLSQYMDQTNPLAEITHKRRISSLGIGGISRESAGMAIRGIHPTHYGRICPIETPEGKNAGLVNSLAFYTKVDRNGFLKTPYYRVFKGQIQSSLGFSFCSAKEESLRSLQIAPSDLQRSLNNVLRTKSSRLDKVPVRVADNLLDVFKKESPYKVQLMAISPIQMISVATSLIPFLEHNDANRALMGSNMQRQAVPLMISERPIVGTGLESNVIVESGHITESQISGFASHITANEVVVDTLERDLRHKGFSFADKKGTRPPLSTTHLRALKSGAVDFKGSPSVLARSFDLSTCLPARARHGARLPLATLRGVPRLLERKHGNVKGQSYALSKKKPNLSSCAEKQSFLRSRTSALTLFSRSNQNTCITEKPLIREFDWVQKGDVVSDCSASKDGELAVGKNVLVAYIPWEGYNFEDAIVISERLVKEHVYTSLHIERYVFQAQAIKDGNEWFTKHLPGVDNNLIGHLEESGLPKIGSFLKEGDILVGKIRYLNKKPSSPYERLLCDILGERNFAARNKSLYVPKGVEARVIYHKVINTFDNDPESKIRLGQNNSVAGSTEFVQIVDLHKAAKTVHLFLGERRVIQVGDKISGRHGNKGVISTILPRQDMPYLPDGTPIDIVLNPLGVPSRMNVGQVLESLLGLAALYLHQHFKIKQFDERYGVEASKSVVFLKLYQARLQSGQNWLFQVNFPGKTRLIDGRSGECFDQWITVGKAYILKLIHMVSEKIHARSTGPYALITQQPLRGRSNKGGQRLGEMEVWALEGFGAAYTLQELLTKKSDDSFGRKQIVDSILPNPASVKDVINTNQRIEKTKNVLGHPEIFKVLLCELQALCLDLGVYVLTPESFQRSFLSVVH